ncbi:MAG: molybdopterin biosynthesis protein [Planctomycetaceae bacterium]|nr:molybdopterin biosynthesis protein [Planctomycetaceae bacterium]
MSDSEHLNALRQSQFLEVIGRDQAEAKFHAHLNLAPLGVETAALAESLGRVLAEDVISKIDVTSFDRSNVDGFAVRAADTYGADEENPVRLTVNEEILSPGVEPKLSVQPGTVTPIATGGMVPRGADAIVMVEQTDYDESTNELVVQRAVSPGQAISYAGLDIAKGETVLRLGDLLTSREIGVLAAIGTTEVNVWRKPTVAIISTGDEIVPPGDKLPPGCVYDSNAAILAASVTELGGEPHVLGVVRDDEVELRKILQTAFECDVVLLSGGTSKGAGDLSYRVVSELTDPGIVAHGVALKPGKPICLAVSQGKPVVILPGFPTSAIFTFHEFVAPVIRTYAGQTIQPRERVAARVPRKILSERGRTEYLLVGLIQSETGLAAYPMGKGSGSVTTFSRADGFIVIDQQTEQLMADSEVEVHLLGHDLQPADLVVIGSHCVGLDLLLSELAKQGFRSKLLAVGSQGGLVAASRGECDLAGIHLLDENSGEYNRPFLTEGLTLTPGYGRQQGFVFRSNDERFRGKSLDECLAVALEDPECRMINRNAGSGTRILIDQWLNGEKPPGYAVQAKSHNAVAAAVSQGRADWGLAIDTVATSYGLEFLPYRDEQYDFVIPTTRAERPAVQAFKALLQEADVREKLRAAGFVL